MTNTWPKGEGSSGSTTVEYENAMEDVLFPWSDLMVQLPWFDFLRNQSSKSLGPSLGVIRMWTKGMTMHQKVNTLFI